MRITERGESFYQPMMSETVKDLESKGTVMYATYTCFNGELII